MYIEIMKNLRKTTMALLVSAFSLTSCGLFAQEVSNEDGLAELKEMSQKLQDTYGEVDMDEMPPFFQKMTVKMSGTGMVDGKKVEAEAEFRFNIEEDNVWMVSKEIAKEGDKKTVTESYCVQSESSFLTWKVEDGVVGEVEDNGFAVLGVVLLYAVMVTQTLPDFLIDGIEKGTMTAKSYKKYIDGTFEATVEQKGEPSEDDPTAVNTLTVSYKDCLAKSMKVEGVDANGEKTTSQVWSYKYGEAGKAPVVPAK